MRLVLQARPHNEAAIVHADSQSCARAGAERDGVFPALVALDVEAKKLIEAQGFGKPQKLDAPVEARLFFVLCASVPLFLIQRFFPRRTMSRGVAASGTRRRNRYFILEKYLHNAHDSFQLRCSLETF